MALREVGKEILHGLGNWPKKGSLPELAIEHSTDEHGWSRQDVKPLPPASGAFDASMLFARVLLFTAPPGKHWIHLYFAPPPPNPNLKV